MRIYFFLIQIFLCLLFVNVNAQNNKYFDFTSNESICYCTPKKSTPQSILAIDNNWEILLNLVTPKTTKQLDSIGLKYTISQLRLLEDWSIIEIVNNNQYKTIVNIFDSIQTEQLRSYSMKYSKMLIPIIDNDIKELRGHLELTKKDKNAYTILFSYILDDKVWDYMKVSKLISEHLISIDRPFWSGDFWTLYPKRIFYCGTNSFSNNKYSFKVNWSENSIPNMIPFFSRWDLQNQIISDLYNNDKVSNQDAISVFKQFNVFDSIGNINVPLIFENRSDFVYNCSNLISDKIVKFVNTQIDIEEIKNKFGFADKSKALIALYHEMMWDILTILEKEGKISKPIAFSEPNKTNPFDISNLIIIVKK
jgi:hypothetical protein